MNQVASRSGWLRLLVFVPARRNWPAGARGTLSPSSVVPFLALRADGSADQGAAPIGRLPKARTIDLVFDCLDVFSASVEAPRLNEARLRQALPNLLEERMLADPADCHFASTPGPQPPGTTSSGGADETTWLSVAAIDRTTLARTLEAFAQAQLHPHAAYSEIYTLPAPRDGTLCLRIDQGRGVIRTGWDQGCAFDIEDGAPGALALARHQLGIQRLRVYGRPGAQLPAVAQALGVEVEEAQFDVDLAAVDDAVNLLQGSYASGGGFGIPGRLIARLARQGAWRAPAAWLGVCAAIGIGGLNAYWLKLDAQYRDLRTSMRHTFRDAFPGEPTIIDELAQAARAVQTLRARAGRPSADDFSVLNAQALQVFASAPVGIVTDIEYADRSYRLRFKPGSVDKAELRNALQARAIAQGMALRFDADGSARLAPQGG
ncbi:hypothetical protein SBBP1_590054 [Burkholderiales bacterium]|nr:hypothetical protein SBBP1_590054 [Burkholderiales bacterium]